jgi:DNA-binding NarL/FixJ family response regulator
MIQTPHAMARILKKKANEQISRIFLVEDHPVFRDGLAKLIDAEPDLTVCGAAGDARQALESINKIRPDLAVVDLSLPGKSGLELIKEIRALKLVVKLLVVSMFDESLYAQRVLRAGGDGFIMKQENPEDIIFAIRDVLAGHIYVSEEVFTVGSKKRSAAPKATGLDLLKDSELEILELLGRGKSALEISRQLRLPVAEVDKQGNRIRQKLKLKSLNALIRYAVCWVQDSSK